MNLIYTSDIHGNIDQYKLLFAEAQRQNIQDVIIGGDIAPKNGCSPALQADFLKNELFPLLNHYRDHSFRIFIMPGNDDWACCQEIIKKNSSLFPIHDNCVPLSSKFNILGYSYVPLTPFGIKDWEKWDVEEKVSYDKDTRLCGIKSRGNDYIEFCFDPDDRHDCIQDDLKRLARKSNPGKTIYVFHSPPFNTNLDIVGDGRHVGSAAVRQFIEKRQPPLTLHGHIHGSVVMSGSHTDQIGKTLCAGSGNFNDRPELAVLIVDMEDIINVRRKIVNRQ